MADFEPFATLSVDEVLSELPQSLQTTLSDLERSGMSWDQIGTTLASAPMTAVALKGLVSWRGTLWNSVKLEIHSFVCTDSETYSDLRREWDAHRQKSISFGVAALSGVIGAKLGVAGGVVAPLVIWGAVVAARIGRVAFCSAFQQHVAGIPGELRGPN